MMLRHWDEMLKMLWISILSFTWNHCSALHCFRQTGNACYVVLQWILQDRAIKFVNKLHFSKKNKESK